MAKAESGTTKASTKNADEKATGAKRSSGKTSSGKASSKSSSGAGGRANNALMQPVSPSKELSAIVGADKLPRSEVVKKVWDYIKKNSLQNPQNKREINADEALGKVFGKDKVTMFEMNKHLSRHLS